MAWQETLDNVRSAGIILDGDQILLIHRLRDGREYWVIPGGSVEPGESIEQALDRELDEELGIKVLEWKYLFRLENAGRPEHYFLITQYSGIPKMGGPEMERANEANSFELEWRKLSDLSQINLLPEVLVKKIPESLEAYRNR